MGPYVDVVVLDHLSESTPTLADVTATPLRRDRYAYSNELVRMHVTGDHAGLVPWLATRPLIHTLSWTGIRAASLDLSALSLTSLTLAARETLTVKLPASLEELSVRVRDATPITFEAARDGAFLSLYFDVWSDDDLDAIGGLTHARGLSIRGFGALDLSRRTRFFDARTLEFEGVPGRITRSDALARFTDAAVAHDEALLRRRRGALSVARRVEMAPPF